jgi:excisionase family DNA binding protein
VSQISNKHDSASARRLWTIPETAEFLRVSRRTVARLLASGALRTAKFGRCVRVVAASADELIDRGGAR